MIETRVGNLLTQDDLDVILHQANCFCTMGSGIAAQIKKLFPEAYEADCKTVAGDVNKLGSYTHATIDRPGRSAFTVVNLYGQGEFRKDASDSSRFTSYDALYDAMKSIYDDLVTQNTDNKEIKVGLPYLIGCDRGGASWRVVLAMIQDIFASDKNITCVICKLP